MKEITSEKQFIYEFDELYKKLSSKNIKIKIIALRAIESLKFSFTDKSYHCNFYYSDLFTLRQLDYTCSTSEISFTQFNDDFNNNVSDIKKNPYLVRTLFKYSLILSFSIIYSQNLITHYVKDDKIALEIIETLKNVCKFKKLYEYEGEQGTIIGLQIIPLI